MDFTRKTEIKITNYNNERKILYIIIDIGLDRNVEILFRDIDKIIEFTTNELGFIYEMGIYFDDVDVREHEEYCKVVHPISKKVLAFLESHELLKFSSVEVKC